MWNSFRTDARTSITAKVITYPGGGWGRDPRLHGRAGRGGAGAGVVAVHHLPGWYEFYREFAERLARHGYSAICPDLYDRFGHGTPDDVAARVRSEAASPMTAWWPTARPRWPG
jgi:carboxymethylenebutenolidase